MGGCVGAKSDGRYPAGTAVRRRHCCPEKGAELLVGPPATSALSPVAGSALQFLQYNF